MDKQHIGKLIILLRKQNNMQQKELAELLYVSASTVSKWENGVNHPSISTLIALSEIFHVPASTFLHPEEFEQSGPSENLPPSASPTDQKETPTSSYITRSPFSIIGYICALVLLCTLIICFIGMYRYLNPNFTLVTSRYAENPAYGTVYEMSVVCPRNVPQDALHKYTDKVHQEWVANQYAEDASSIQVYFYPNRLAAQQWNHELITTIVLFK